jgi:DNA-binding cell septation regulator SpoVG
MLADLRIRSVRFVPAGRDGRVSPEPTDPEDPILVGHASAVFAGGIVIDGFGVYLWPDGKYTVSFPARKSPSGRLHNIVRTTSPLVRDDIVRRILEALRQQRVLE